MSAFFVSIHQIDVIVSAAIDLGAYSGPPRIERVTRERGTLVGQMLLRENLKSMIARYPRIEGRPEADGYQTTIDAYTHRYYPGVRPSAAAHAVNCYDYQACEDSAYETSQARRFVESMQRELLRKLPGIEQESSGIDSPEDARAATVNQGRLIRIG